MKYTLKQVKESMPSHKNESDSIWTKIFGRPIGNLLSVAFLNVGVTPNQVSLFVVFLVTVGSFLLCVRNFWCMLCGLILLNFFIVFDCVDGAMARTSKRASYMGEFFDAVGGYTMCLFSMLGAGMAAFYTTTFVPEKYRFWLILIGALGGASDIFGRLIYQKYTGNEMLSNMKQGIYDYERENDAVDRKNWKKNIVLYVRLLVDGELGVGGFFPPILLAAFLLNVMDVVVVLYGIYHFVALFGVMFIFCRKATAYDKEHKFVHD